jgi:hypothetical protein
LSAYWQHWQRHDFRSPLIIASTPLGLPITHSSTSSPTTAAHPTQTRIEDPQAREGAAASAATRTRSPDTRSPGGLVGRNDITVSTAT